EGDQPVDAALGQAADEELEDFHGGAFRWSLVFRQPAVSVAELRSVVDDALETAYAHEAPRCRVWQGRRTLQRVSRG
ncbi:MAG: hypothetical protein OXI66_14870, partial [Boseongicola sp.]|nr:hypothetical protein [Boseongicola sp.]